MAKPAFQRARKSEDKALRRDLILTEGLKLFRTKEIDSISMQHLADRSGLAKGTLYLYFKTKEEVFLGVMKHVLQEWLAQVELNFSKFEKPLPAFEFSKAFVQTLNSKPELPRLLSQLHLILEKNISEETAFEFKSDLKAVLQHLAQILESKAQGLDSQNSFSFLIKCYSLLVGTYQVCNPSRQIQKVLEHPDLEIFRMNFQEQLEQGIGWLLLGLEKLKKSPENSYHLFENY